MKIGFIGAGNMGSALSAAVSKKIGGNNLYICDSFPEKAEALANSISGNVSTAKEIWENCDYVFFAVKPQVLSQTIKDILDNSTRKTTPIVVSMAAGISIETLESYFENIPTLKIIRIMPNTPAAVGKGIMLVCNNKNVSDDMVDEFCYMMSESGMVSKIPENLIDAASALSGCGPAFVYMFIESLADGAVQCGLSRQDAIKYAAGTVIGAAEMVLKTGEHPEKLKDNVCSPKGSTIVGVHALEEKGFRASTSQAVIASFERTKELGKN